MVVGASSVEKGYFHFRIGKRGNCETGALGLFIFTPEWRRSVMNLSIPAEMVDMETWAIVRACMRFETQVIGVRGISDGHAPVKGITCWTDYLHVIDEKLATVVDTMPEAIESGMLSGSIPNSTRGY